MTTPPIPAELKPMIDGVVDAARGALLAGEELPGIAYIDTPNDPFPLVAVAMARMPTKDLWAKLVRMISERAESRFSR